MEWKGVSDYDSETIRILAHDPYISMSFPKQGTEKGRFHASYKELQEAWNSKKFPPISVILRPDNYLHCRTDNAIGQRFDLNLKNYWLQTDCPFKSGRQALDNYLANLIYCLTQSVWHQINTFVHRTKKNKEQMPLNYVKCSRYILPISFVVYCC